MGNIIIDYESLKRYGNQIIDYGEDFKRQTNLLLQKIESLKNDWSSDRATKFIETMKDKVIYELNKISEIIEDYGKYARNVSEAYSRLDNAFATKKIDIR